MESNEAMTVEIDQLLQRRLNNGESFNFELLYDKKKFTRNGFFLLILSTLLGGGLGAIIDLIYLYSGIVNQYAILGIGSGAGAVFGLVLGIFLLLALKSDLVEDYGVSYGLGIGTNIFIGGIIGTFFGTLIGSLFGLIMKLIDVTSFGDYIDATGFSYPVFGMLVWICLGLNIGVLVGLIASFGFIGIIFGGALSGVIVGAIGMLAIFGPDIVILYGSLAGLVAGSLIALLVRYSINASIGKPDQVSFGCLGCFGSKEEATTATVIATGATAGTAAAVATTRDQRKRPRAVRSSSSSCNGGSNCDCGSSSSCDGGGEGLAIAIAFIVIVLVVIVLVSFISMVSARASVRLGDNVKRGALTAFGACFSVFLIIGANVGLTESFHNILFEYNVLIGAGIALIFASLIFASLRLSLGDSNIKITPQKMEWKDRHTKGSIAFINIDKFEMALQAHEYKRKYPELDLKEFLIDAKGQINIDEIRKLFELIKYNL